MSFKEKSTTNLLEGNIKGQLIALTLPLLAGEILQQLYNTIDSLIIGHFLGTEAFAASGISGSIMNLFIFVLSGFCLGVSVMFSGSYGMGDMKRFRRIDYTATVFGAIFSVTLSIVFILLTVPLLRLLATPENLIGYCRSYIVVILSGLIATYFYNLLSGILRSIGETAASLLFLVIALLANVILDLLFVAVLPFGIAGAALATVIAQLISAVCCYFYIQKRFPQLLFDKDSRGFHKELLKQIISYGSASALHQSSLFIGKLMVQGIVNTCGTAVIAAYTATTRIEAFINAPGNGCAQATSIFIAQNLGAGNKKRTDRGVKTSFTLIMSFVLVMSVIMYFISPAALKLFLDASEMESLASGTAYLRIIFFFYFLSYLGYFFVGCSRGYGKMSVPFAATTLHLTIRVILSYLLIGRLGLAAVAYATGIGWFFCVSYHYWQFRKYHR